ncbi:MAG TPA: hypothetical protein VGL53_08755, partial [Bryobacteraceae bacterium]
MFRTSIGLTMIAALAGSTAIAASNKEDVNRRLQEAASVLSEVMSTPEKSIPQDLLDRAHCIV